MSSERRPPPRPPEPGYSVVPVPGLPMIEPGDDLARSILDALAAAGLELVPGDVVCIAQKIVSKAEGRQVALAAVEPGAEARALATETEKDPRMVQLVLDESTELVRKRPGALIMRHRLGFVCAHAGIDQSNIEHSGGEQALLLPEDPDASARALKSRFDAALTGDPGSGVGVIITDSHNRPWRLGTVGTAIGSAGVTVLVDHRGGHDLFGRELKVTLINRADAIAGAAALVMGETTERVPVALVRGLPPERTDDDARMINRPLEEDLFR